MESNDGYLVVLKNKIQIRTILGEIIIIIQLN